MKDYPIKWFWSKLMVKSRSINNIPDQYLEWAQNVRIYDGGIGPRKWKRLLLNSTLGTVNRGGFSMNSKLYQIANSKIYEINTLTGAQTEKATLWYDALTDILVYWNTIAVIVSVGQTPKIFNGTTVTDITTVPASTTGILEYCRNFSFITKDNILYISRPITAANPEYAYDWTGSGSQNITYDSKVAGLKSTMNGLYVFLDNKVEYLGANALQNVSGAATFISTPLGEGAAPISNLVIAASGDKIFYISKNLQIQTVNFVQGATNPSIGELSARPVVWVRELLKDIDPNQPNAFAFYNENDKTIQFHVRSTKSLFNDYVIVYDLVNDTFSIDVGKYYNYIIKHGSDYYGYSDINTSVFQDDVGYSDAGSPISTKLRTWPYNANSLKQKMFWGIFTSWSIWFLTEITYTANIDGDTIFQEDVIGNQLFPEGIGELSGGELSGEPVAWDLIYVPDRQIFDRIADEWRIYATGTRIQIEMTCTSLVQDWIIDMLWFMYEPTNYIDTNNKF